MFELQAIHKLHLPNRFFPPRQIEAGELTRLFVFLMAAYSEVCCCVLVRRRTGRLWFPSPGA